MTLTAYFAPEAAAQSITARAFESLPSASRSLLWYMDIEHLDASDVCVILGIPPAELITRTAIARYELRFAWIAQQENSVRVPMICKEATDYFSHRSVTTLPVQQIQLLQNHLESCIRCSILEEELGSLHDHLRMALLPLVLGPSRALLT